MRRARHSESSSSRARDSVTLDTVLMHDDEFDGE
jgi:hypothetical protein